MTKPALTEDREEEQAQDTPVPQAGEATAEHKAETPRTGDEQAEEGAEEKAPEGVAEKAEEKAAESAVGKAAAVPVEGLDEGGRTVKRVSWRARVAGAVTAALFAAAVTAGVLQWREANALAEERAARMAVSTAAGQFSRYLLTYDYRDLQTAREQVLALSTGDFLKTYDEAFINGALQSVIIKLKAVSTASVRGVYVGDVGEARAEAIVPVDQQVTSDAGTRRVLGTYLDLKLSLEKGVWKVDEVVTLGAADEQVTKKDGTTIPGGTPTPGPSPAEPKP
ncbi:hypothetical protein GCM10022226_28330 [Sphaerisporangium flaviroseum]|uniref:Mce-associated membrane protein n=1 Tax=Sphaerisporangium flaviroseum TaxID=509199 RepID=A0ABP7HX97_9ACTN